MTDLLDRLPDIAQLVTGQYADTIAPAARDELLKHIDRRDWIEADIVTVREMLPARLRWLLRDAGDR